MADDPSPSDNHLPTLVTAAFEVVVWWGLMLGIWVLTLSSVPLEELIVAVAASLPCAVAVCASRRAAGGRWRPHLGWVTWLAPVVAAVWADLGRVMVVAVKAMLGLEQPAGELRSVQLPAEGGARASARHAIGAIFLSSTPGTFVMDEDPDTSTLVVHSIVSGPPSVEEVIAS